MSKCWNREILEPCWNAEKLIEKINQFAADYNVPLSEIDVRVDGYIPGGWDGDKVEVEIELETWA